MDKRIPTILGISPGTRTIGIAVLRNGDLMKKRVKSFKERWSKEKVETILITIEKLIRHFQITTVALKAVDPLRSSTRLNKFTTGIPLLLQKMRVPCRAYTIEELKLFSGQKEKGPKDRLMEFVTEKYPELRGEYLRERNNLHPYYAKMFEAITAAMLCEKERNE